MILAHRDSKGRAWYFSLPYDRKGTGKIARYLRRAGWLSTYDSSRTGALRTEDTYTVRDDMEEVILKGLSDKYPATEKDYNDAAYEDRYVL